MTTPEAPTSGELLRAIGRLEKTTDQLGGKIDRLDDRWDGHAEQITRGEVRLSNVEKTLDSERQARMALGVQIKAALVAGCVGVVGGVAASWISLVHH
jgi:hypothetical protein